MAKLKVSGSASGTGTITLIAPATSTDRTITLPDESITLGGGVDGIVSTADATAITIDSSENVGIGVTPETDWSSNHSALQISQTGAMFGRDSAMQSGFLNNARITGGDYTTSKYIIADQASVQVQRREGFFFYTAPSGSADAAITWTKQLHITDDGRGLSQFTARMWCNLNGTGTIAIRDSHNVSSIADGGTGFFTVYIDNDMANSNHVHFVTAQQDDSGNFGGDINYFGGLRRTPRATGGVDLSCQQNMTNPVDPKYLMVVVFGE